MAGAVRRERGDMKRAGGLWPGIVAPEALHAAYLRARKGKRFTPDVLAFEAEREANLRQLREQLEDGTYRPGVYRTFTVRDPKPRLISAAPFRDRVVHHALVAAIEPAFENGFIYDSYANRVRKGTHAALRRYRDWCAAYPFALRCDVAKFFPSMDHDVLKGLLRRKLKDGRVLDLCDRIIDGWAPGLPIGNLTSQLFQNVYLDPLDHFVKETLGCRAYLRYVDDFVLLARRKAILRRWRDKLRERLAGLSLRPNERTFEIVRTSEGINWLGFFVTPDDCRLRRERRVAFRRRLRLLWERTQKGRADVSDLGVSIRAWVAHASHGRSRGLRRHLLFRSPPWRGGVPRGRPCAARGLVEQQSTELPLCESEQERAGEP